MDQLFFLKNLSKRITVYVSAAMLFATAPVFPAFAAENTQMPSPAADNPAQPESPPSSSSVPAGIPDASSSETVVPAQNTEISLPQLPTDASSTAPQLPADTSDTTPQIPADATAVTPLPEPVPADQGSVAVTPMQSTVYAASPKGLNVRSGPSTGHSKLGTLKYGEAIAVTGVTADNWYQIQYSGGVGYVLADYVSATPLTTESPSTTTPAAEIPPDENPVTTDTAVSGPDNDAVPDEFLEDEDDELLTEDDSFTANTVVTGHLVGTPVIIILGLAIAGIMVLIGYTVYSLFKKEDGDADEYDEDDYYSNERYYEEDDYGDEQSSDDEYYESEQYVDDEYYESEQYYEEGQYSDDEYSGDGQYSDDEYYENDQYPDRDYYEDEQYSDDGYYEEEPYSDEKHVKKNRKKR